MNPLRKAYCRTYQFFFRIALPILPYREPEPLASVEEAAQLLKDQGKKHPLIVTDPGISKLGLTQGLEDAIKEQGLTYSYFDQVVPNPTIACVEEARDLYERDGCDSIVAFGGGSSMDCAKVVGARIVRPNKPIQKMRGILKIRKRLPLLIAVPTTAGTGSETTLAAVITDGETHYKYPINDFSLIPHYAVLDYRVTLGLPPQVTSTTGMDALVHAVEAYIGHSTTKETRANAIEATSLVHQYLKRAYDDGSDAEAREKMLRAAYCAGAAFTKSYVGYIHGIAHSLGGQYGVPHGLANAVIMPYMLEHYGEHCYARLGDLARQSGVADADASDEAASKTFIDWVRQMNSSMDIPDKIEGILDEDIPGMAAHADKESNPLYPVPMLMDADELAEIYHIVQA
ncbi:MAG: iron-containing alcohol dehydrogenase [Coriobacteriaceae bacterium]|nr:iron-containing alcohol dehydrogenase [Coriobacteriaceae bacterium]